MEIEKLVERLGRHPALVSRLESLLDVAENRFGDIELADTAEERIVDEGRAFNKELLSTWAAQQSEIKTKQFGARHPSTRKSGKKNNLAYHAWRY